MTGCSKEWIDLFFGFDLKSYTLVLGIIVFTIPRNIDVIKTSIFCQGVSLDFFIQRLVKLLETPYQEFKNTFNNPTSKVFLCNFDVEIGRSTAPKVVRTLFLDQQRESLTSFVQNDILYNPFPIFGRVHSKSKTTPGKRSEIMPSNRGTSKDRN
uniref:Uncharacterized protein n=1 Tax=Megaselia scalaris TaxID=36166 RepID=T1GM89_MEGSC